MLKEQIQMDTLVTEYGHMVSAICRRMIQDQTLAEDVAQEVWIQIMKSKDSFKGRSKLSTWIYTICYRVIQQHWTKEKVYTTNYLSDYFRNGEVAIPEHTEDAHTMWVKEMCDRCLTGILHCLDNESRLIYLLRDVAQLDYMTIADICHKKEPAIRKIVSRSRTKLKNFLQNECTLYNPNGQCHCRMKEQVNNIKLDEEYHKIRNVMNHIDFFLVSEKILPTKNYWKKYI
ncbi:sigma-70 family RNA polymerase sigma factor [Vallitalea pronyensis]|uniref:Sigma-70 family RNA polymerase sigma factor n=1 Tax=Vallitalea pronyensis TaxID=1348613 RepID=A0A8J8SFB5_9FIRM|nr:sigma-70 family RNA polymerase sigma factor [Vallitalea pronyensis]QUI21416.1 sigma-70 family RNA polymerase sigma factor [Vallitalea pronyensis]